MAVFINEMSFSGQCQSHTVKNQITSLLSLIKQVQERTENTEIHFSSSMFQQELISGQNLGTTLKDHPSLNRLFIEYWKKFPKWNDVQQHNCSCTYLHNNTDYSATSIAEAAERTIQNQESIILNIDNAKFSSPSITITKSPSIDTTVCSFHNISSYENYLQSSGLLANVYDYNSSSPPRDFQTILSDTSKFSKTSLQNRCRILYQRIGFDEYWCVDNQHTFDAHLEVFNSRTDQHLGTSKIESVFMLAGSQVKRRRL